MTKEAAQAKFYMFSQNNSGGAFDFDETAGIAPTVIIEALSYEDANERAEKLGLYFNGVENNIDCECCGDRWYPATASDGDAVPSFYGTPLDQAERPGRGKSSHMEACVHLMDGQKIRFRLRNSRYVKI